MIIYTLKGTKLKIDLHNHTLLCNHATGTMQEYVEYAINKHIDIFGFSDHAPMDFDTKYRMSMAQTKEYEDEIQRLQKKYANQIKILKAYEVDYISGYIKESIVKSDIDYLIGSVHFIDKWGFDNPEFIGEYKNRDIDKIYQEYFEAIESMAKSRLFNIVGHIDLIKVFNHHPKGDIKKIALNAIKEIKKAGMAVEINSAGYRKPVKEQYPSKQILELCFEYDIPICFGSDAHKIEDISYKSDKTKEMAKHIGYSNEVYFEKKTMIFKEL